MVLVSTDMNTAEAPRRTYRSEKRKASAADTRRKIIDATIGLYGERFHDQITLEDIAIREYVKKALAHAGSSPSRCRS